MSEEKFEEKQTEEKIEGEKEVGESQEEKVEEKELTLDEIDELSLFIENGYNSGDVEIRGFKFKIKAPLSQGDSVAMFDIIGKIPDTDVTARGVEFNTQIIARSLLKVNGKDFNEFKLYKTIKKELFIDVANLNREQHIQIIRTILSKFTRDEVSILSLKYNELSAEFNKASGDESLKNS